MSSGAERRLKLHAEAEAEKAKQEEKQKKIEEERQKQEEEYKKFRDAQEYADTVKITTTNDFGDTNIEYIDAVFGEVIQGTHVFADISTSIADTFGERSGTLENILIKARNTAIKEMKTRAYQLGANGVIAVRVDYETVGEANMLLVTASGTAVKIK